MIHFRPHVKVSANMDDQGALSSKSAGSRYIGWYYPHFADRDDLESCTLQFTDQVTHRSLKRLTGWMIRCEQGLLCG